MRIVAATMDLPEPIVEAGSLQTEGQEEFADLRPYFGARSYLGMDMRPGPGVELLGDLHRIPLSDAGAGTILMLDTLEHVADPVGAIEEAHRALRPGGVLIIGSVMNFPIHNYPADYWRFTPAAFDHLLRRSRARAVMFQGDAEFPRTVLGVAIKPAASGQRSYLRGVIQRVLSSWPEDAVGGPLVLWEATDIVLSQRRAERRLETLRPGLAIEQTFACPQNGLARVDVCLSSFGQWGGGTVFFTLTDGHTGDVVATYRLSAQHIGEGGWRTVPIPAQEQSAGRVYTLTVSTPDGLRGHSVSLMAADEPLPHGALTVDGETIDGSICMQVHCLSDSSDTLLERRRTADEGIIDVVQQARDVEDLELVVRDAIWGSVQGLRASIESRIDATDAHVGQIGQAIIALQVAHEGIAERVERAIAVSDESATFARSVRSSRVYRLYRRLFGGGDG